MGRRKGSGLERPVPFTLRMTRDERETLAKDAERADVSENALLLCRYFGYPLSMFGGKEKPKRRRKAKPAAQEQTHTV